MSGDPLQAQLVAIFQRLKALLKRYEGPLQPKFDLDSKYDLWSFKRVVIDGRKKNAVYFAGIIIQSTYVGFYYMPIYVDTALTAVFHPELLKRLKGKSCFHIRALTDELAQHIAEALERGYRLYRQRGWI